MLRARILLWTLLHSTRPVAARATAGIISSIARMSRRITLFIAQRVNRIELCRTRSRIESSRQADKHAKHQGRKYQPPGNGGKFDRIQVLPLQVEIGSHGNRAS